MYILAGQYKGRKIALPEGKNTRPTLSRVRQILFDILSHSDLLPSWSEVAMLDVFAGSGSIGLEALSRGAKQAIFVENDHQARRMLQQNMAQFGLANSAILLDDALRPPSVEHPVQWIFLDPPYHQASDLAGVVAKFRASGWCNAETLIVAQVPTATPPVAETICSKKIGVTRLDFMRLDF